MSSSGSGGSASFNSAWDNFITNITPVLTLGMQKYDGKRGFTKGNGGIYQFNEAIGEVTGRNMQREMMHKAEARAIEEERLRDQMIKDEQFKKQQMDIAASSAAAVINAPKGPSNPASYKLGSSGAERDFLGI